jgi:hypothetical protein
LVDPALIVGVNFLEGRLSDITNIAVGSKVITQKLNAEESKLIMNNFKQKALISALAGAGALAMAGAANAVYVNQDGLGQALVYPYYTVRGGNVTLVSVVNTTTQAKAVKVRFLEGKNSVEVLDFNLFLSAKDVWTGAILPTAAGAAIYTGDRSCTNPRIPAGGVEFRNTLFLNDAAALQSLDRTREGYVEMLEMATIPNATALGVAVTHSAGTAPCTVARINDAGFTTATGLAAPSGGLFGNGTILNPLGGMSTGYDATAFDGWSNRPFLTSSGSLFPNLASGSSKVSVVNNNGAVYIANWANPIDAVSATIMHSSVYGEYAYTKDGVIGTDWVVTMPTKNQYVSATFVVTPFQSPYSTSLGQSCDDVSLQAYDREEVTSLTPDDFSPRPPSGRNSLCYEANVIAFGGPSALSSTNIATIPNPIQNGGGDVLTAGKEGGWLELGFTATTAQYGTPSGSITTTSTGVAVTTTGPQTYFGLPTIGFAMSASSYKAGNPQQNYSSSYSLRFQRTITGALAP